MVSKAFYTIYIHTLMKKLLQTNTPGTIMRFIANYIKGRKSIQCQFKTGVPQCGVLSPTLFNIYTADLPPPRASVQLKSYAHDITITSTHKHECSHVIHHTIIPTYIIFLDKTLQSHTKSRQNNLHSRLLSLRTIRP